MQKSEVRSQKSEVRSRDREREIEGSSDGPRTIQKSETRDQKSELRMRRYQPRMHTDEHGFGFSRSQKTEVGYQR